MNREIVSFQAEMKKRKIYKYMRNLLVGIAYIFEFKEKWFTSHKNHIFQREMERKKNTRIYI
jgi:hypothetical protein